MTNARRRTVPAALVLAIISSAGITLGQSTNNGSQPDNSSSSTSSSSSQAPPGNPGPPSQAASTYVSPTGPSQQAVSAGERGVTFIEFYGGSATSIGYITDLESSVGYNFNDHFGVDVGVPLYIIGASANKPLRTPAGQPLPNSFSEAGLGDVYVDLMYTRFNPTVNYLGSVRLGAPTGSVLKGLGTGHVTFNWENHFDRDFGRFRPYLDAGVANSILDTHFLYRPFTTYGFVVPSEVGASVEVVSPVRVGASFYDDAPFGPQTVFRRPGGREVRGPASIDRDDGASVFASIRPTPVVLLEIGYDRSLRYDLNSFSFGIVFDVAGSIRRLRAAR